MKTNTLTRKKESKSGKAINMNNGFGKPGINLTEDKFNEKNTTKNTG